MNNKQKLIKLTTNLTAVALTISLTSGCNYTKGDKFYITQNKYGELVVNKNDYISMEYINNYYLIELYNKVIDQKVLYIAHRLEYTTGYSKYTNIFTNYKIAYDNNEDDYYDFISVTPLLDYLIKYDLVKEKYTYTDMNEIFKIIKENYQFNNKNSMKRKLIINNQI